MDKYFDFEKSIEAIDKKIKLLEIDNADNSFDLIKKYNLEKNNLLKKIYNSLTSWQKVQVARHSNRPHTLDYINKIFIYEESIIETRLTISTTLTTPSPFKSEAQSCPSVKS